MIRNPHYLHSVVPRAINKVEIIGNNGTGVDLFPYIGSLTLDRSAHCAIHDTA